MGFINDWKAAFSSFAQTVISGVQGQGVEGWRHCTFYHDTHLRSYAMMYFLMMRWLFCLVQPLILLFTYHEPHTSKATWRSWRTIHVTCFRGCLHSCWRFFFFDDKYDLFRVVSITVEHFALLSLPLSTALHPLYLLPSKH